eukprot:505605_1
MDHGLYVEQLREKHKDQAVDVIMDAFLNRNEPNSYHLRSYPETYRFDIEYYVNKGCNNDLSVVTIDQNNNKIVGVSIAMDYNDEKETSTELQKRINLNNKESERWRQFFARNKEIDQPLSDHIGQYVNDNKKGNVVEFMIGAVHKDYVKQNIATKEIEQTLNIAKKKGFKYLFVHCSNEYSKRAFLKLGFKILNKMEYEKWEYPKGSN